MPLEELTTLWMPESGSMPPLAAMTSSMGNSVGSGAGTASAGASAAGASFWAAGASAAGVSVAAGALLLLPQAASANTITIRRAIAIILFFMFMRPLSGKKLYRYLYTNIIVNHVMEFVKTFL